MDEYKRRDAAKKMRKERLEAERRNSFLESPQQQSTGDSESIEAPRADDGLWVPQFAGSVGSKTSVPSWTQSKCSTARSWDISSLEVSSDSRKLTN